MAFIFMFNLVVGVGALTMPAAFSRAGAVAGVVIVGGAMPSVRVLLRVSHVPRRASAAACLSYITATFVVEALSLVNALMAVRAGDLVTSSRVQQSYSTQRRVELSQMVAMLCPPIGFKLFVTVLALYLYADIVIYSISVGTTLQSVFLNDTSSLDGYHKYVSIFWMVVIPFCFMDLQRTQPLQYAAVVIRFTAMATLIVFSVLHWMSGSDAPAEPSSVRLFDLSGVQTVRFGN
jgi:amino acid permease